MAAPHMLDRFELLERVGPSRQSLVFRARDTRDGGIVALRVLPAWMRADRATRARFDRETRIQLSVRHPNVVALYEVSVATVDDAELVGSAYDDEGHAEVVYVVQEFVEGEILASCMERERLSLDRILGIGAQVAAGLGAIHGAGAVLRNLSPRSVRLTPEGDVKIVDFGLAKILQDEGQPRKGQENFRTATGKIIGTAPYFAPEQIEGSGVDNRTDLFSLGVVLYEMVSGRVPFGDRNLLHTLHAIVHQPTPPLSSRVHHIPPELGTLLEKLLSKHPDQRHQTAAELIHELQSLRSSLPG